MRKIKTDKQRQKKQQTKRIQEGGKTKSTSGTLRNSGKVTVCNTMGTTCEWNNMSKFTIQ